MKKAQARNHFKAYAKTDDEVWAPDGKSTSGYKSCIEVINSLPPAELQLRQSRIERAFTELGLHFDDLESGQHAGSNWQLDIFPKIFSAKEWRHLSTGVLQRAQAFNAYIRDVYTRQTILRDRILPHSIVLGDPAFQRPFNEIMGSDTCPCLFGAIDLVKTTDAGWQVLENHLATPFGLAFVLQNRRMLAQAFPELFHGAKVCPVASFTTHLLEGLRNSSEGSRSRIVLLTRDESNQAFFEESFLARHMGIALTRPGDLIVRDGRVFLKTIRGLEQIDVIYRRLESASIDPVAIPQSEFNGVPGLVNCARKGTVKIVNALGSGVADNRAMLRYSDRLISYYLRQKPILRTVPTYNMSDRDQAAYFLQHEKQMLLKPIQDHRTLNRHMGGQKPTGTRTQMLKNARQFPELYVAQPILQPSHLPHYQNGKFVSRGAFLRLYFLLGENPMVLPGGLTRQSAVTHPIARKRVIVEPMKDTWIPRSIHPSHNEPADTASVNQLTHFSISSRVAEALYWIGRYLDRAESTARQLHILEDIRWDQLPQAARQSFWPLWRAVAAATGQSAIAARRKPPKSTLTIARQLLLDPAEPASILSSIRSAQFNAASIRDFINPETWQGLVELALYLENESQTRRLSLSRLKGITLEVVDEIARIWGTAERTMLHDDGWQFFRAGTFMERAISNMTLTGFTLKRTLKTYHRSDEEDPDLAALLQLLGSLDAYRRAYSSRAYLNRVAYILIQSANNPSSVAFCLANLRYCLSTLSIEHDNITAGTLHHELDALISQIHGWSLEELLPNSAELLDAGKTADTPTAQTQPKALAGAFESILESLNTLHERIEDAFFSHQDIHRRISQIRLFA